METVARLKPVLTGLGPMANFGRMLSKMRTLARDSPTNPSAQNVVTPNGSQAENPNTEERLPNPSPEPKKDFFNGGMR